jgi:hypothetical protein
MSKKLTLTTQTAPQRPGDARATKELTEEKEERVYFKGPARYLKGLNEIGSLSPSRATHKALLMEALDDLYRKYASGNGRQEVPERQELTRRLENLGCID